ncbi:MAG: hypothetical protein WC264_01330 [Candidatus Paceibacterota bacterium]|jgi:hypothetical protein
MIKLLKILGMPFILLFGLKFSKLLIWVVLIVALVLLLIYRNDIFSLIKQTNKNSNKTENTSFSNLFVAYPMSGKEVATMDKPVRAYLDPTKTNTRIIGPGNGKYVLESDPSRFFICNEKPEHNSKIKDWALMPAGNYLIYPEGIYKIIFYWYQIY